MKLLVAPRKNDRDWSKHFVDESDYDVLYSEDVFVRKENGDPLLVLLKGVIPPETNAEAWSVLKNYNPKTENRSTASGTDAVPRKKLDGTYSKVSRVPRGWEVISGIVGYFERTVRQPIAHPCAWNQKNPDKFKKLFPLVDRVNELYRETVPDKWKEQQAIAARTPKDYLIGKSNFTTLTVNKNFRTSAHKDAGDLPEGFSCMTVIEQGRYKGANLVLPNYGIAADIRTGDLIMFDPHEFHGNTQIVNLIPKTVRCSIVYYFREKIQFCKTPEEELERAKNRKLGDPLFEV